MTRETICDRTASCVLETSPPTLMAARPPSRPAAAGPELALPKDRITRKPDKTLEYRKGDSNEWTSKSLGGIGFAELSRLLLHDDVK
mgnify:CR=1 FL=1